MQCYNGVRRELAQETAAAVDEGRDRGSWPFCIERTADILSIILEFSHGN